MISSFKKAFAKLFARPAAAEEQRQLASGTQQSLQTVLDMLPIGVRILRISDGALVYANKASLKVFNCDSFEDQVADHSGFDFMPEVQPDGRRTVDVAAEFLQSEAGTIEMQCLKLGGEPFLARITSCTIDYQGSPSSLAVIEDMTEEKERQQMLQNTAVKEREANQLKSRFIAHMSHEIRTPMNAILGTAEIQLQNESLAPETAAAFDLIYDSGNLLLNIINDVLDISQIESGRLEIKPVKYDVPSLINDTMQLNLMRYEGKPIEFVLTLDENTPQEMFGDEHRIMQILNNLLTNAFKYTDGGEVGLSVAAEVEKNGKTSAPDSGARTGCVLVLRVSDTGQGMTKEQVGKLFDDFVRFNVDKNRTTIGTGLGMSITKRLVDMMNGEITVESEPGKGSTVTVRLPQGRLGEAVCGAESAERLRQHNFQSAPRVRRAPVVHEYMPYGSVMIVDDVESNLYVAEGLLSRYGLKIETAASGLEAVEKIKNGSVFDVVFMDHMMPEMDGMEATKAIRDMGYAHPVVALTANAVAGQADMFMANGFDGFISKPIDLRELNAALNKFVRDKQPGKARETRS